VIGFLGRLVMEKGLDVFADSIDELTRRGIAHKVLVVGEGPARGWFEARLPAAVFVGFQTGADLARTVAINEGMRHNDERLSAEPLAAGSDAHVKADADSDSVKA